MFKKVWKVQNKISLSSQIINTMHCIVPKCLCALPLPNGQTPFLKIFKQKEKTRGTTHCVVHSGTTKCTSGTSETT